MKQFLHNLLICITAFSLLTGCSARESGFPDSPADVTGIQGKHVTAITFSGEDISVNGTSISSEPTSAVYAANDIVFYPEGKDFTFGEGTEADAHSQAEADKHTVIHITKPGTYILSGTLSAGQIAVDLGEDADEDPEAIVNLILKNADITCSVAPAVIFYNVYECGDSDTQNASKDVDTSKAGANIILADDSENTVSGSYVARIYESYELSEDGTEVIDSEKLHKYDGAFYSKMSMNIYGEDKGNGILNIYAENEGLGSELHLTLNGGTVNITSGNDGINTNEDEVSVTTINSGNLNILVSGETGEGDGIDSNGWLVINGGTVSAQACGSSGDSGIDSDMGIHINGGTVSATGNMLDRISESTQTYAVFQFMHPQKAGNRYVLKNTDGDVIAEYQPKNDFSYLILSSNQLTEGNYTLWNDTVQFSVTSGKTQGGPMPGGFDNRPGGMQPPDKTELPEGEKPELPPDKPELPEGEKTELPPDKPAGPGSVMDLIADTQPEFEISSGGNYFMIVE